jgi:hypothetical protein
MSKGKTFQTFSTIFKEAAMRRLEAGQPLAALSRELRITRKPLYDWHKARWADGVAGLNRKRGPQPGPRLALIVFNRLSGNVMLPTGASA